MIPKVIHYCWFGRRPLPRLARKCIASWRQHFPGYEIKEWNEDNFDINIIPYTRDAYRAGKYAFVSDYARIWILYHYGGIYFDTDVEVIAPMEDIIRKGAFMGCEIDSNANHAPTVNPGLGIACKANNSIYADILDIYENLSFVTDTGEINRYTIVRITTDILQRHGLRDETGIQHINNIQIYPTEYFNPMNSLTGVTTITPNTRSIHHYMNSWSSPMSRIKNTIGRIMRRLVNR